MRLEAQRSESSESLSSDIFQDDFFNSESSEESSDSSSKKEEEQLVIPRQSELFRVEENSKEDESQDNSDNEEETDAEKQSQTLEKLLKESKLKKMAFDKYLHEIKEEKNDDTSSLANPTPI